jgi:hypothetical protein
MTQQSQKDGERFYVENAAKLLDKRWCLSPDRESPDFIVIDGAEQFGLEVCEIFTGQKNRSGSRMKRVEFETQRGVNTLQAEYESKDIIPLTVRFVGDMCEENMAVVLPALAGIDLSSKAFGYQDTIEIDEGKAKLRVYVTRALQANWFSVNDRAGSVDRDPIDRITKEIEKKSENLPRYKERTGLDDIRLLVAANRIMNSGKLSLTKPTALNVRGFQAVYFLSYPESVVVFE